MTRSGPRLSAIAALASAVLACSEPPAPVTSAPALGAASSGVPAAGPSDSDGINPRLLRRFQPLESSFEDGSNVRSMDKTDLGRMLFFDPRLSSDGTVACESCHRLETYGVDHLRTSPGVGGRRGTRNTPTVMNAAGLFAQFWDGRVVKIEDQAREPILGATEMGMTDRAQVEAKLRAIPGYVDAFRRAFPGETEPTTLENVGAAIGAFERGLVTPGRWDRFLRGERDALSRPEKEGLKVFLNAGCMVCHTGRLLGGSMFERAGVVERWPNQSDKGREEVTHQTVDAMMFKVPTLRNVAMTAPYFHDGSASTLEEAVRTMGTYQLGLDMSDADVASIATWLRALTGEVPEGYVAKPTLPDADIEGSAAPRRTDYPLQIWMKANPSEAFLRGDMGRLERSFGRIGSLAPPEYLEWRAIASAGATAAASHDVEAARKACADCHRAYRADYRRDHRADALP